MRTLSRVVWSEGMHLAQHHFQVQSRYFEDVTAFTLSNLFFKPYGLVACELDAEALRNGTVSVVHARGILPDGLPFQFPEDPAPEPLQIRERFSPTADAHVVMLCIPAFRPEQPNCALDGEMDAAALRYGSAARPFPDETTGGDDKPVQLARKNFRLMLDAELDTEEQQLVRLPIARIRRDGAGHFIYDPAFIPPCLQIGASTALLRLLSRLAEILESKAESISTERRGGERSELADLAGREIVGFWLSHAIHSALGPVRHHLQTRTSHPEALYTELARLGGALCTFTLDAHPRDLPAYDHDAPERCFHALDAFIRRNLEVVLPAGAIRLALQPTEPYLYTAAVTDRRCIGRARWFLGVRAGISRSELVARVPDKVKVCSAKFIVELVKRAYPGLTLEHLASPPAALGPRLETEYFSITRAGACWDTIVDTAEVGVYVPGAIPEPQIELVVVPEE